MAQNPFLQPKAVPAPKLKPGATLEEYREYAKAKSATVDDVARYVGQLLAKHIDPMQARIEALEAELAFARSDAVDDLTDAAGQFLGQTFKTNRNKP